MRLWGRGDVGSRRQWLMDAIKRGKYHGIDS